MSTLLVPKLVRTLSSCHSLFSATSKNYLRCLSGYKVTRGCYQTMPISQSKYHSLYERKGHFHTCSQRLDSDDLSSHEHVHKLTQLSEKMAMRLLNENSFLSWCRNAYLSTVLGVAMMEQASSTLAQSAGFGAFLIGAMNVYWGTGCHVTNLVRLRHVSGMSTFNLFMNVCGSLLHCLLFSTILVFYVGFLDERSNAETHKKEDSDEKML